jgi:hypothetical protein
MTSCRVVDVSAGQTVLTEGRKGVTYIILAAVSSSSCPNARWRACGASRVRPTLGEGRCREYGLIDDRRAPLRPRLTASRLAPPRRISSPVDQNDRIGKVVYANLPGSPDRPRPKDKELISSSSSTS